jgi:hypothetical protein
MIQYNIHKEKLQLWTNADKTEYAIYIISNSNKSNKYGHRDTNDKLLIETDHNGNVEYTQLLDESDYLDDLEYDWKYTLEKWIDNERNKDLVSDLPLVLSFEEPIAQKQMLNIENNKDYQETYEKQNYTNNKTAMHKNLRKYKIRRNKKKKRKNLIKCHFCKLQYSTNGDRLQHEQSWHIRQLLNSRLVTINNNINNN